MKSTKATTIKLIPTVFLRLAIVTIGAVVLALCVFALPAIWSAVETEYPGHTYAFYSILTAMYIAAVPFFFALYQAIKILGYIDKKQAFTKLPIGALKKISVCGVLISVIYAASMPFFYIWAEIDDAPGLVIVGLIMVMAPLVISVFTAVLGRLLQEAINIKSENDLTV